MTPKLPSDTVANGTKPFRTQGVFAGIAFAALVPGLAAGETATGPSFEPYGWLHFAYQSFDDGQNVTSNIVDIQHSTSRFGFYLRGGGPLSFQFETSLGFRPSSSTSQIFTPDFWDWSRGNLRKVQLILSGGYGKFRIGQGSMALDGGAELDLSGTSIVAKSNVGEGYGAYLFRAKDGALTSVSMKSAFDNMDNARRFRLRYDTPDFGGFSFAAAYGHEVLKDGVDDTYADLSVRYANTFDRLKVKAVLGIQETRFDAGGRQRRTVGSVSMLDTGTGLSLSVAAGKDHEDKAHYVYGKAGWNGDLMAGGQTRFLIEGYWGNDYLTAGSASRMVGIAAVQNFDRQKVEAYLGYRRFSYEDATPTSYQDAHGFMLGARWKF